MSRRVLALCGAALFAVVSVVGCSSQDEQEPVVPEEPVSTVEIDGESYTCDEIIDGEFDGECGEKTQSVFDEYKHNIDAYVQSDALGPLFSDAGQTSYQDAAFAGLVACTFEGQAEYVQYMQDNFDDIDGVYYVAPWLSRGILCPELASEPERNLNPGSNVLP